MKDRVGFAELCSLFFGRSLVDSSIPGSWLQPIRVFRRVAFCKGESHGCLPRGACCEQVENDRFLSGVRQPLMSLSGHPEENQHAACPAVQWQGRGRRQRGVMKEEERGREGVLVSCMVQCISHVNEHLTHLCWVSVLPGIFSPLFKGFKEGLNRVLYMISQVEFSPSYLCSYIILLSPFTYPPSRMLLKCLRRAMNSTRSRVHAWPSGELHLSWRVCPGRCSAWKPLAMCPAWGSTLRQWWR